jgi:Ca2+-binding RTX toxin-like protein
MYGGTGNDTFNPGPGNDFMFGGAGHNTFNDNTGNDYYRSGGTANVYWFGEAHSGHDTVANFKSGTDTLKVAANLNGNGITTASQLIAGATVSSGNTVLHLSAQDDITLLGISSPSSIATAVLVS